jgi:hypothetical protein
MISTNVFVECTAYTFRIYVGGTTPDYTVQIISSVIIKLHLPDNPTTIFSIFSLTAHTHPIFCPLCESRNPICSKLVLVHLSKYEI